MTRRDMIIIAVLVNAGLLAILFMMAINSDDDNIANPPEMSQMVVEAPPVESQPLVQEMPLSSNAESDNALKEFQIEPAMLPVISDEESQPQEMAQENTPDQQIPQETIPAPQPIAEVVKPAVVTPEPVAEEQPAAQKYVDVTVKKGDSLDKIARANNTTIKAIKAANDLKTDRLKIGQVLRVPVGTKKAKTASAAKKSASKDIAENKSTTSGDAVYHTIKSGDNPWKIAKQYHIKVSELLKLNNLDEEKARNLKTGDKIRVK